MITEEDEEDTGDETFILPASVSIKKLGDSAHGEVFFSEVLCKLERTVGWNAKNMSFGIGLTGVRVLALPVISDGILIYPLTLSL